MFDRLVEFHEFCHKCAYCNKKENEEPCDSCLEVPVRTFSRRPVNFKAKDGGISLGKKKDR